MLAITSLWAPTGSALASPPIDSSNPTAAVAQGPPMNLAPPTVSGPVSSGATLTEGPARWTDSPTSIAIQWSRCGAWACIPIAGATGPTYVLSFADAGSTIQVQETAINAYGSSAPASSAPTASVTVPSTTTLIATQSATVTDQTLTLIATVTSPVSQTSPSGSLTFTRNRTAIPGCSNLTIESTSQSATVYCQTSFPASVAGLGAAFDPVSGSTLTASTSPGTTVTVGRAPSSVSLRAPSKVDAGARAQFVVQVKPPANGSGRVQASGRVAFMDRGKMIRSCHRQPVQRGRATCTLAYSLPGTHRLSARYGGDANFRGAGSSTSVVTVQPAGQVASDLSWTFFYTPTYTTVKVFAVSRLVADMSISITCDGNGCPFTRHTEQVSKVRSNSTIDLTSLFGARPLAVGTQLTVSLVRRYWVGKYYQFTVQAGQQPAASLSCLAVGGTRPGVDCTPS